MLSKESKIRVLEDFYALDYVFFGKPVSEVEFCCPLVKEEYLSVKGALMSVYVEMLKLVDHKPSTISEMVDGKALKSMARKSAKIARENSERIVSSPKARANIKGMLKEELSKDPTADVSGIVEKAIRSKAFGLAVDNLLIARSLKESKNYKRLMKWEGQIIEDSYKILRDNLVEVAYMILYDNEEAVSEDVKPKVEIITNERLKEIDEIASQDNLMEAITLLETAGTISRKLAFTYAEYACGLRGKDRVLKFQLGYRKCFWEKVLSYYDKRLGEHNKKLTEKCSKKEGPKKQDCINKVKTNLAKLKRVMDTYKQNLAKVNERIKKKGGKTWKI